MRIGEVDVRTPTEDGFSYDLGWRSIIAHALVDQKLPIPRNGDANDPKIRFLVQALKGQGVRSASVRHAHSAHLLHNSQQISVFLEAALLTRASYATLADDIGTDPQVISLYESLYFNVRDPDGEPISTVALSFAISLDPNMQNDPIRHMFYAAALQGGYSMLRQLLPHRLSGMDSQDVAASQLVERELNRRLLQGEMTTSDLIRLRSVQVANERMQHETGQRGSTHDEGMKLVQSLLQAIAPKMVNSLEHESDEELEQAEAQLRGTMKQRFAEVTDP